MKIEQEHCPQGSYGLRAIKAQSGVPIGKTMRVWHLFDDNGERISSHLTRAEARTAWSRLLRTRGK